MRIIAGSKRGMKLLSPKCDVSRPITDRVKESLFSVLYKYDMPEGKRVADLFCGVGSLGLEALSREAEFVTFVEKDRGIISTLKRNIEKAGFVKKSRVVTADAFSIGGGMDFEGRKYDLAFVDPPYMLTRDVEDGSALGGLMLILGEQLSDEGVVVVRTERRTELLEQYGRFEAIERRQWGTMAVNIFRKMCG
jgi:16S rRNA (guanine966-N2)-methyltransferase